MLKRKFFALFIIETFKMGLENQTMLETIQFSLEEMEFDSTGSLDDLLINKQLAGALPYLYMMRFGEKESYYLARKLIYGVFSWLHLYSTCQSKDIFSITL